ncbi:MAG TPA: patatin-like phospholipase family protein [Gemmataceae bacterium]|jgi:NTE family protein
MTLRQNDYSAVVLSGGGAHGAYEVGVLTALMTGASWTTGNRPLAPDVVTGTSIGAYNAAVLVSRLEADDPPATIRYLADVWRSLVPPDGDGMHNRVLRLRAVPPRGALARPVRTAAQFGADALFFTQDWLSRGADWWTTSPTVQGLLGEVDLSTAISREPTRQLVRDTVSLAALRQSRRALFIATTNWRTGQLQYFRNADMTDEQGADVVMASSALPGIFEPVRIGGDPYVDGGLAMNTPLGPAFVEFQPGADTAHVIYLDPETADIPVQPLRSTVGILDRMITIGLALTVESDMRIADHVNRGLQYLDKAKAGQRPGAEDARTMIESVAYLVDGIGGRTPDSPKTIHRYRPSRYLGGMWTLLDFSRATIEELIELGYRDVMNHDCVKSKCVLPTGMQGGAGPVRAGGAQRVGGVAELVAAR